MSNAFDNDAPAILVGLWRLASWKRSAGESARWVAQCLELGVRAFDLADVYGDHACEELFGDALVQDPSLRERMAIVTKCDIRFPSERRPDVRRHHYDTSLRHIVRSVERSLENLRTDRVELLLLHRPDPLMDPDEVAEAFEQLARQGKVQAFGVSNFTPSQFSLLASRLNQPLVTNQLEVSVLCLDAFLDGAIDQLHERGRRPMAWSPLGGGRLFEGDGEQERRVREVLERLARERDTTPGALAYAFLLRHPARLQPITGSGRLERVREALDAQALELDRETWFEIWTASTGEPLP